MSRGVITSPISFTRREEIREYAELRKISFAQAVVELVNHALSHGALVELQEGMDSL